RWGEALSVEGGDLAHCADALLPRLGRRPGGLEAGDALGIADGGGRLRDERTVEVERPRVAVDLGGRRCGLDDVGCGEDVGVGAAARSDRDGAGEPDTNR